MHCTSIKIIKIKPFDFSAYKTWWNAFSYPATFFRYVFYTILKGRISEDDELERMWKEAFVNNEYFSLISNIFFKDEQRKFTLNVTQHTWCFIRQYNLLLQIKTLACQQTLQLQHGSDCT